MQTRRLRSHSRIAISLTPGQSLPSCEETFTVLQGHCNGDAYDLLQQCVLRHETTPDKVPFTDAHMCLMMYLSVSGASEQDIARGVNSQISCIEKGTITSPGYSQMQYSTSSGAKCATANCHSVTPSH